MKRNVLLGMVFVLVLSLFFVTALSSGEIKTATSGGRYQLLQGTFTVNNETAGTATEYKTIFKIDTETGKTWSLTYIVWDKDGIPQTVEYWREIKSIDPTPIDFSDLVPKGKKQTQ